ncbi:MAG: RNA polymerase sigma factor [bacterium]
MIGERRLIPELKNVRTVIQRCQNGEVRAFEIVYRHFEQPMLNLGLRMLGRQEDAEDAVQSAFIRLYRSVGNFKFHAKFETYLTRIMMNVCFDMLKKRRPRELDAIESVELAHNPQLDLRLQLEQSISELPDRMRACFVLFAVQNFKQKEVAEILNMKLGTVKATVFQAKARLRDLLSDFQTEVEK